MCPRYYGLTAPVRVSISGGPPLTGTHRSRRTASRSCQHYVHHLHIHHTAFSRANLDTGRTLPVDDYRISFVPNYAGYVVRVPFRCREPVSFPVIPGRFCLLGQAASRNLAFLARLTYGEACVVGICKGVAETPEKPRPPKVAAI